MFAPIRLYQKCHRISLVRAIDKLSLFINKNLTLATNHHTTCIQSKFNELEEINFSL